MNETNNNAEAIKSLSPETTPPETSSGKKNWSSIKRNGKGMAPMAGYNLSKFQKNYEEINWNNKS